MTSGASPSRLFGYKEVLKTLLSILRKEKTIKPEDRLCIIDRLNMFTHFYLSMANQLNLKTDLLLLTQVAYRAGTVKPYILPIRNLIKNLVPTTILNIATHSWRKHND